MNMRAKILLVGVVVAMIFIGFTALLINTATNNDSSSGNFTISPEGVNSRDDPIVIRSEIGNFSPNGGRFTSVPSYEGEIEIVDNYIIVWPKLGFGFEVGTEYTFTFTDIQMATGQAVEGLEASFIVEPQTPPSQIQEDVVQKYDNHDSAPHLFLNELPYSEEFSFNIEYTTNEKNRDKSVFKRFSLKNDVTVIINTLTIQTRNQSYEEYIRQVEDDRNKALRWISSKGIDPTSDINYEFVPSNSELENPDTQLDDDNTLI